MGGVLRAGWPMRDIRDSFVTIVDIRLLAPVKYFVRVSINYCIINDIMPPVKPQPNRGYSAAKRRRFEQLLEARTAKKSSLEPAVVGSAEPGPSSTSISSVSSTPVTATVSDSQCKFSAYYVISVNHGASLLLPAV